MVDRAGRRAVSAAAIEIFVTVIVEISMVARSMTRSGS
jgi:hypothetical protein